MILDLSSRKLHPGLPVFTVERRGQSVIYVPGHVVTADRRAAGTLEALWRGERTGERGAALVELARSLEGLAVQVTQEWDRRRTAPFQAECLNVALPYACGLGCEHCYARPGRQALAAAQPAGRRGAGANAHAIQAAAEVVAECCQQRGIPFQLVLQGLGEPTSHWSAVKRCVDLTGRLARQRGLAWQGHVTTNGQLGPSRAAWLADNFTSISLSCDGPPELQDALRPRRDGEASSRWVQRTAQALLARGADLDVRATITPRTMLRIGQIVRYVAGVLGVRRLRVELVFRRGHAGFAPDHAHGLVYELLAAEDLARSMGTDLLLASPRLNELHGPFCEAARDCLRLTPDGRAINCFCGGEAPCSPRAEQVGQFDADCGVFRIDQDTAGRLKGAAMTIPPSCRECLNQFHCARACPEACPHEAVGSPAAATRCAVQKQLAMQWIWRAGQSRGAAAAPGATETAAAVESPRFPAALLAELPNGLNKRDLADQWSKAASRYRMDRRLLPAPPWAEKGYDMVGQEGWPMLREAAGGCGHAPMSVYIHVPMCSQKCLFCDCHSFRPLNHRDLHERRYVDLLLADLELWARQTAVGQRPVTTVHFGGGTPNSLTGGGLERIVDRCRRLLAVNDRTEWAIETTGSMLEETELVRLGQMGFSRAHVGVQTLDGPLRQAMGRRTAPTALLRRLRETMDRGFTTSVDVIYGLPGQDAASLLVTLAGLVEIGIDGVSLYRLNLSTRNRGVLKRYPNFQPDGAGDYVLLQYADQCLSSAGYRKNHFTHYALPADRHLYYRHAVRGEDLLALGASASGVFGRAHFRCMEYRSYARTATPRPALEGVLLLSPQEHRVRPLLAGLMGDTVSRQDMRAFGCERLLDEWLRLSLVQEDARSGHCTLTAGGTWLVSSMLDEVRAHAMR